MLTATAAGTLLGALWFVPSANATQDEPAQRSVSMTRTSSSAEDSSARSDSPESSGAVLSSTSAEMTRTSAVSADAGARLADTGGIDTTPYVMGGTLFLGLGAGFVAYSVRRERATAC
ncbi:LPXTG cell wall anchor domain-containing protein [Streptomyces sp. NPDC005551]|uniref:LPXTG cell wall anchor domain-containing protein n=1 Tax=unclassified Streptomyces TaxID=2593676 RepID=UPI0033E2FD50